MSVSKIILVDDHVFVRDGIKALLEGQADFQVINEACNGIEALEVMEQELPDIMIVDIRMPEMNGIELVKEITAKYKSVKTMMLSMHESEEYVVQAIEVGADGYLLKGASKDEFLKALHAIAAGEKYFSGDISSIIINNFVKGKQGVKDGKKSVTAKGSFGLTKRQKQILSLVLQLKNNKEIAKELDISRRTTEVHRFNLMKKLEVKNIKELSEKAIEYNLI
ncbi:response regulator transcription factor [Olleya sp. HaHaR_3_96]|uniref:response regulator transcription factor n=1 Tax=Olleya sp. HaHaR_3_96 TaxID=2745560 RepID=UPI001C501519|nr:response regulator transcription factor [Olleya sp. HaHaR_3_96]QXP59374.1 response regulator transcription factor [Olleya sp. HaHaR_3_96]